MLVISTLSSDSATAFLLPPGVQRVAKTFSMRQQPGLNPLAGNQHCGSRYSDPHPKNLRSSTGYSKAREKSSRQAKFAINTSVYNGF